LGKAQKGKENIMSKLKDASTSDTCSEDCYYWKWFQFSADILTCDNPDSDHYKHILDKYHPACLAGIQKTKEWKI